ncbi:unnamed protein product, partial [Allacma fusca]
NAHRCLVFIGGYNRFGTEVTLLRCFSTRPVTPNNIHSVKFKWTVLGIDPSPNQLLRFEVLGESSVELCGYFGVDFVRNQIQICNHRGQPCDKYKTVITQILKDGKNVLLNQEVDVTCSPPRKCEIHNSWVVNTGEEGKFALQVEILCASTGHIEFCEYMPGELITKQ